LARFLHGDGAQKPRVAAVPVTTAIVPATPNYSALTLADDGEVLADPILAWIVFANGRRRPVTVGEDRGPQWAIERSDGVIDTPMRSFENRATWAATLTQERAAATAKATP
jgi:hypothetical protein